MSDYTAELRQWVDEIVRPEVNLAKVCYIAIMPESQPDEAQTCKWNLEIEANADTIAGEWATNTDDLAYAREMADELDRILTARGIQVIKTRKEWEKIVG